MNDERAIAVQVLSASVASGLLFYKSKGIAGFENPEATAEFCLNLNAFDIYKYVSSKGYT